MTIGAETVERTDDLRWSGPGARAAKVRIPEFFRFLKHLFVPPKGHRVVPTRSGIVLIIVSLGVGAAAYNTASNILFITLSLLLSCLILSGILSWFNFLGNRWRLTFEPPFRVGLDATVNLEFCNRKRLLPTYGIWCELSSMLSGARERLVLVDRLDPGQVSRLEWEFRPQLRGLDLLRVQSIGSQFPFGFLVKSIPGEVVREVRIWPSRIDYVMSMDVSAAAFFQGETVKRPGWGSEFINLRKYQTGDPFRQVHWKASARMRHLMVRQTVADNDAGFVLQLDTPGALWNRSDQFELLCSLAASLAEDLFRENRLIATVINGGERLRTHRLVDLERFLDQLATLEPVPRLASGTDDRSRNVITFEPTSPHGVHAIVSGQIIATA